MGAIKKNPVSEGVLRKVQLTGGATLIVSLPKEWVKKVNLKPGDYVVIVPQPDNTLKISLAREGRVNLETVLKVTPRMSPTIALREFVARYLLGYNTIKVILANGTRRQREMIRDYMARSLIGVEIVEEAKNLMVVQCLAGYSELPLKTALRRMSNTTYYMISDVIANIREPSLESLEDIVKRDDDVDKFYLYIVRQMNLVALGLILPYEVGLSNVRESVEYVMISKSIERIADHAVRIAESLKKLMSENVKLDDKIRDAIYEYGNYALELYLSAIKALFKKDSITAHDVIDRSWEMRVMEDNILRYILYSGGDVVRKALSLRIILESFKRIGFYSMDISEHVISLLLEPPRK